MSFHADVRATVEEAFNPHWIGKDPIADRDVAEQFLYHDCDADSLAWALTTRREFYPSGVYDELVTLYDRAPSSYIPATQDRTIRPEWQARMARERLGVAPIQIKRATARTSHGRQSLPSFCSRCRESAGEAR